MEKIKEVYIATHDDMQSYTMIKWYISNHPTEKGYRIETFVSPNFVRITIYKERK